MIVTYGSRMSKRECCAFVCRLNEGCGTSESPEMAGVRMPSPTSAHVPSSTSMSRHVRSHACLSSAAAIRSPQRPLPPSSSTVSSKHRLWELMCFSRRRVFPPNDDYGYSQKGGTGNLSQRITLGFYRFGVNGVLFRKRANFIVKGVPSKQCVSS